MSNFPTYYFQDIPAEVMHEIMAAMEDSLPEPHLSEIDHDLVEIEHWLNRNNRLATIAEWYDRVAEPKASR